MDGIFYAKAIAVKPHLKTRDSLQHGFPTARKSILLVPFREQC